jgi:hypothetical protein
LGLNSALQKILLLIADLAAPYDRDKYLEYYNVLVVLLVWGPFQLRQAAAMIAKAEF